MDKLDMKRRSENMRRIHSKNTRPEVLLRSLLHRQGYRFRLHPKDLPGHPDIVFRSRRKVIFVHGCFWHQHSKCREGRIPGSRSDYWAPKLERNRERDQTTVQQLHRLGWRVMIVWQCELDDHLADVISRVSSFLEKVK